MTNVLTLAEQDLSLKRTSMSNGGEWHSRCLGCGGTDRFCVWPSGGNDGRYWCRQCGRKGDAIQYLRDFRGLSFLEAKRALGLEITNTSRHRAERAALLIVRDAYLDREKQRFCELTDVYRSLLAEREDCEIACRAIQRRPDLYTQKEKSFWTRKRASINEQIESLEHEVNVFTFKKYEAERFALWAVEQKHEQAA